MTEIVKMVPKKQYVSFDGIAFDDANTCQLHEEAVSQQKLQNRIRELPFFRYTPEFVSSDYTWKWYSVSSDNDLNVVKAYYALDDDSYSIEFKPKSYPTWIAVSEYNYGNSGRIEGTAGDVLKRLVDCEKELYLMIQDKEKEI